MLAATDHGLYHSADLGQTWYPVTSGLSASTVKSVIYTPQDFVAYAVLYGQLYRSKDGGATVERRTQQFPFAQYPSALATGRVA